MDALAAAVVRLNDAEPLIDNPGVPVWVFGIAAFGILVLLLVITMMINVDR